MAKILVTGGSGLLCKYLIPLLAEKHTVFAPSHNVIDITKPIEADPEIDLVIHTAAYTDVKKAEIDREDCWKTNIYGTRNLRNAYDGVPFVYISSEYAKYPRNYYAYTKREGERFSLKKSPTLVIRTLFKPTPWPFDVAFKDQYTQGDYVDVIAALIVEAVEKWDNENRTIYVGTGRKSIYELAKRTKPDVKQNSIKDIKGVTIPSDY